MALKIRRGLEADRLTITPADGEFIYTTDGKKLYIGDGATVGGNLTGGGVEEAPTDGSLYGRQDSGWEEIDLSVYPVKYPGKTAAPTATDDVTLGYLVGDRWLDETNDKEYVCLDNTEDAAVWIGTTPTVVRTAVFTFEGRLTTTTGAVRIYNKLGATSIISQVFIAADTAPTGDAIVVDVHKDGTTIFTNQAHRPQIADASHTGYSTDIDDDAWADGEYLSVDIDQVGSTYAGDNLTVHVVYS